MFQNIPLSISRKRVFDSVFPPAPLSNISPTPVSSPVQGFTRPGETFDIGYKQGARRSSEPEYVPEQVTWDRAWHTATSFLSIPDEGFRNNGAGDDDETRDEETLLRRWAKGPPSQLVSDSLFYVGADSSPGRALRQASEEEDVKEWYLTEMRRHFLTNFRDFLVAGLKVRNQPDTLLKLVRYLRLIKTVYFTPFLLYLSPLINPANQEQNFSRLQRNFHTIVTFALPPGDISYLLSEELATQSLFILGVHNEEDEVFSLEDDNTAGDGMEIDQIFTTSYAHWKNEPSPERRLQMISGETEEVTRTRSQLLHLLEGLQEVGLGASNGQKIFAGVMNNMLTEFVTSAYAGQWESPSLVKEHLRQWIENVFARLVVQILHIFKTNDVEGGVLEERLDVTLGDVERWQEMGIARLGALRISELFDVIIEWDSSSGAIEDLKHYTTNPATRLYLVSSFVSMLVQRLLHPGASTVQILQIYISIIRAFTQLDPPGVLLNHVARPIRRYLRDRDDTVKVIVGGLLADTVDADGQPITSSADTLVELAMELSKAHELLLQDDSGELDWDDMNWMPDPIDVATDYKKSKSSDVIGSLISLFDTKEAFVRELQKVLGERLLKKSDNYDLEVSLLELLKLRFGDSALQACQVMLRDVQSSERVDSSIRSDQKLENTEKSNMPELHAKILSRLFWPTLQNPQFTVPPEIASLQQKYSAGFESLKQSRKLTWLNGLGQVTVELDLEDRVFTAEVTTWQAAVIYAFQTPPTSPSQPGPVTKTISELSHQLGMSPSLARSACLFWLSKRILVEPQPNTFRVLETIPDEDDGNGPTRTSGEATTADPSSTGPRAPGPSGPSSTNFSSTNAVAAAEAAEAAASKESADAAAMAKMDLYWQFIVGMLTNQGAMPLQRIIMMLKIVVPGGFPFSSEELRGFLSQMVAKGKLEVVSGGSYKIVA
ncbi:anaphase-promoting complex subunit 2 [Blastomyces dermatitidis ATCC 26199]|nr:anaphase-promoting complex subunit 2 [Blastomyces dermatitidis ATCC 26199]